MAADNSDYVKSYNSKETFVQFLKNGWSNLIRLMASNVLFVLFNIPAIIISYFAASVFVPVLSPVLHWDILLYVPSESGDSVISYEMYLLLIVYFINCLVSSGLICVGPFQAGFSNVYRSIRNGTSVSFFSDFKSGMKNNIGKSLVSMIIGIVITGVLLLAVSFYLNINKIIGMLFVFLFFAFILFQNLVYQLIASTELKLYEIYRKTFLILLVRFVPYLGVSLILILFYFVIPFFLLMSASFLTLGIYIFLYSFVVISWIQYLLSCINRRLISKFVLEKTYYSDNYSDENEIELEVEEEGNNES